jgi:hypothetical protein
VPPPGAGHIGHIGHIGYIGYIGSSQVLGWLVTLFNSAIVDGRMASTRPGAYGGARLPMQVAITNKVIELRSTYASIADELTGMRAPRTRLRAAPGIALT